MLVHFIQGSGVYFGSNGGVLFRPVLKYVFEVRAPLRRLLQFQRCIFVEVILNREGRNHQVKDYPLVVDVLNRVADDIPDVLSVRGYNSVFYVPVRFLDEVAQEDNFDLVEEEEFADGFENLADRELGSVMAGLCNGGEEGHDEFDLRFGVVVVGEGVLGGEVYLFVGEVFLFHNKKNYKRDLKCI